jgi:glycosyltransferase involved in cell wall biosynthesis
MATGDYLAFLDDDDIWGPEYLARVSHALAAGAECVVSRLDKMIDGEVRAYKNAAGRLTIKKFLVANPGVTGSNVVIEKNIFMKIGGFDTELPTSNDKSFMIEVLKHQVKTLVLPDNQAVYREHQLEKISNIHSS